VRLPLPPFHLPSLSPFLPLDALVRCDGITQDMPSETQRRLCELQAKVLISTLVYLALAFILSVTAVFARPRQETYGATGGREGGREGRNRFSEIKWTSALTAHMCSPCHLLTFLPLPPSLPPSGTSAIFCTRSHVFLLDRWWRVR